jgi:hypothetical protein
MLAVSLSIHNLCQSTELTSPVYFIHGGKWNVVPNQKIHVNAAMQSRLEFDAGPNILEGALVYKIQRKYAESAQDESKSAWLLIAWNGEYTKGLNVHALVIEHNKQLDKDRLRELYEKHWPLLIAQANATKSNWVLDSMTMLEITKVTNGSNWDISISEERK